MNMIFFFFMLFPLGKSCLPFVILEDRYYSWYRCRRGAAQRCRRVPKNRNITRGVCANHRYYREIGAHRSGVERSAVPGPAPSPPPVPAVPDSSEPPNTAVLSGAVASAARSHFSFCRRTGNTLVVVAYTCAASATPPAQSLAARVVVSRVSILTVVNSLLFTVAGLRRKRIEIIWGEKSEKKKNRLRCFSNVTRENRVSERTGIISVRLWYLILIFFYITFTLSYAYLISNGFVQSIQRKKNRLWKYAIVITVDILPTTPLVSVRLSIRFHQIFFWFFPFHIFRTFDDCY